MDEPDDPGGDTYGHDREEIEASLVDRPRDRTYVGGKDGTIDDSGGTMGDTSGESRWFALEALNANKTRRHPVRVDNPPDELPVPPQPLDEPARGTNKLQSVELEGVEKLYELQSLSYQRGYGCVKSI